MGWLVNAMASSDRAPHDDFWYSEAGNVSLSGAHVTQDTAMRLSTVFACIRILMETLASVPLVTYQESPDGRSKNRAVDHPLYPLLHDQPNDWQTSMEFREMLQGHAAMRGNGYAEIMSGSGKPIAALVPLHPDRMKMELLTGNKIKYLYNDPDTGERVIPMQNMFHLRGLSLDGKSGLSVIDYERETVGNGLAALGYQGRILKNDGRVQMVLKHPGKIKDIERVKEIGRQWHAATTGVNRGKTPVLEDGMTIETLGLTNRELQYIESRKYTREEIASIFRIPLVLLQAGDKTQTYASAEQFFLSFVKFTMLPWFFRWEQAMNRDLILPTDRGISIKFVIEGLLRGDSAARSTFYKEGITDGWMTRNEVREKEDMNPLPGLDEPLQQLNMAGPGGQPEAPPADDAEDDAEGAGASTDQMVYKVAREEMVSLEEAFDSAKDRKAFNTWAVRFYKDFRKYMRKQLPLSMQNATLYIEESVKLIKAMETITLNNDWLAARSARLVELLGDVK